MAIGIIIALLVGLIVVAIVFFKLCYIEVPQGSVLVVDNSRVIFTNAIVLPHQKKQLIKILPVQIKTAYLGKKGLYSQDNLLIDVVISYTLCVDSTPEAVLTAIRSVGADSLSDVNAVTLSLSNVLNETVEQIVRQYDYELLDKDRGKLRRALMAQLTNKLAGYVLSFINIDKIELMPLQNLAKQDEALAKDQENRRFEWDKKQKQLLEKRLELVLNQQKELSIRVKKMIADYQLIISKKIRIFLDKDMLR